jgi:hypothetical protein
MLLLDEKDIYGRFFSYNIAVFFGGLGLILLFPIVSKYAGIAVDGDFLKKVNSDEK